MQYESKHTLHMKTTCVNAPFITAYHSVWAYQPMQLDAFWEEEKIIIQNLVPCSIHVKKGEMFIVSQILPVNNPQQISAKVILITPLGSGRGNRQSGKKLATNPMGIHFCRSVYWITCCPGSLLVHQPQCVAQYIHTHREREREGERERLWASIYMFRSCANIDQTILIGPCLWHSSGCLYCNFLPALIRVLSTAIPAGLWDAFIMQEHQLRQWEKCKEGMLFCASHQA